ncbi:hypothetical protein E2C01_050194 [Portunus trituberculatus]|uniref:Secreted protein n=1 Tax=Portunus trituberculatus TaxID=210409 RepID=A0A5B7G8C3_PORTR|nr:hypothetical protein [Portunus trituberculatus]
MAQVPPVLVHLPQLLFLHLCLCVDVYAAVSTLSFSIPEVAVACCVTAGFRNTDTVQIPKDTNAKTPRHVTHKSESHEVHVFSVPLLVYLSISWQAHVPLYHRGLLCILVVYGCVRKQGKEEEDVEEEDEVEEEERRSKRKGTEKEGNGGNDVALGRHMGNKKTFGGRLKIIT